MSRTAATMKTMENKKVDRVIELANDIAEDIAEKMTASDENIVMPSKNDVRAPHGFNYVHGELCIKAKLNNLDRIAAKDIIELIPLGDIKAVYYRRWVDDMFIANPTVCESRIVVYHKGRNTFGVIDEKQFEELKKHWKPEWQCIYTYYHEGSGQRMAFSFNHPDWPTQNELAEKMTEISNLDVIQDKL